MHAWLRATLLARAQVLLPTPCIPILGLGARKHAFYLQHSSAWVSMMCDARIAGLKRCGWRAPMHFACAYAWVQARPQHAKPEYTAAAWGVVNWGQVSANYDAALRSDLSAISPDD